MSKTEGSETELRQTPWNAPFRFFLCSVQLQRTSPLRALRVAAETSDRASTLLILSWRFIYAPGRSDRSQLLPTRIVVYWIVKAAAGKLYFFWLGDCDRIFFVRQLAGKSPFQMVAMSVFALNGFALRRILWWNSSRHDSASSQINGECTPILRPWTWLRRSKMQFAKNDPTNFRYYRRRN